MEFWINCLGAPLVVMEKKSLVVRMANRSATVFFGISPEQFAQCPIERLVGEMAGRMLGQIWSNAAAGITGEPFIIRSIVQGQERLLMVQISQIVVDNEPVRLFTFSDAPPEGSVALAGWQENIIAMLNWLPFGFEIASTTDEIQFVNSHFHDLFGYSPHELESIEDWWSMAYPDPAYRDYAKTLWEKETAEARAENREMNPFDLEVASRDGTRRTIQFRHRTIGTFNVNLYLDVTRERTHALELKRLADTDSLTEIMNRRCFFEQAALHYTERSSDHAVLMMDIDNFKHINDTYGHAAGDTVLQEFSRRCSQAIRSYDLLARMGGEEFAVLLRGAGINEIAEIGERIRTEICNTPFLAGNVELPVTVSIGGAVRLNREYAIEATISRADKALYLAKHTGRNRMEIEDTASDTIL